MIEKWRHAYLASSIPRGLNGILIAAVAHHNHVEENWGTSIAALIMGAIYCYIHVKTFLWVKRFDCASYFETHQARSLGTCESVQGTSNTSLPR